MDGEILNYICQIDSDAFAINLRQSWKRSTTKSEGIQSRRTQLTDQLRLISKIMLTYRHFSFIKQSFNPIDVDHRQVRNLLHESSNISVKYS